MAIFQAGSLRRLVRLGLSIALVLVLARSLVLYVAPKGNPVQSPTLTKDQSQITLSNSNSRLGSASTLLDVSMGTEVEESDHFASGTTRRSLLVYVSATTEENYRFFQLLFDRIGVPHTDNPNDKWTFCWGSENFPPKSSSGQRMNRILGTQPTCSKKSLCESIWKSSAVISPLNTAYDATHHGYYATCFLIPNHWNELKEYNAELSAAMGNQTMSASGGLLSIDSVGNMRLQAPPQWVLKADGTSGGHGVYLATDLSDVVKAVEPCTGKSIPASSKKFCKSLSQGIVQQFVQNPLLIDGRRFSFRVFALMDSLMPMRVFVSYVGFALITTAPESAAQSNTSGLCPWITNYRIQNYKCSGFINPFFMDVEDYFKDVYPASRLLNNTAHVWTTLDVFEYIQKHRPDISIQKLWSNIRKSVGAILLRSYPLSAWRRRFIQRSDQLLFGIDTTFLDNGEVVIFEANCHPYMGGDMFQQYLMREVLLTSMVRMTGDLQFIYKAEETKEARRTVREYCKRLGNCSSVSRTVMVDTELMLRNRGVFDVAVPSFETAELYQTFLKGEDFVEDQILLPFVLERITKLDIRMGDERLLNPTVESLRFLDDAYKYVPPDSPQH